VKRSRPGTDIFALGALLHEIVTGHRAFTGETPAIIASVLKDEPPPVSSIQPSSLRALDFVVRKCLAKDPEDRWQSAADVKSQLEWIAEEIRAPSGDSSVTKRVDRSRREAFAWALAIILAIAALAAGISRDNYLSDWSRNGKLLLFHDGQAIHALPMIARPEPFRLVDAGYKRDEPHFSPDGQWDESTERGQGRPDLKFFDEMRRRLSDAAR